MIGDQGGELTGDKRLRGAWSSLVEEGTGDFQALGAEEIWQAVAGQGSVEARWGVVDRLVNDAEAAESWRLAVGLQRELEVLELQQDFPIRRWPPLAAMRGWGAVAAMVVAAVGLTLMLRTDHLGRKASPEQTFRQGGVSQNRVLPPNAIHIESLLSEAIPLPRDQVVLRWSISGGEGARYTLRVLRSNLDPLVILRDLVPSEATVPAGQLEGVADGERLLWQVEAVFSDGRTVTSSTFFASIKTDTEGPL